jgi:hypothetical protein
MPTKAVAGAASAGGGGGVGGAMATLILAIWGNNDPNIAVALTIICGTLVSALSAFFAVYFTPPEGH